MSPAGISRRGFLGGTAATGAAATMGGVASSAPREPAPRPGVQQTKPPPAPAAPLAQRQAMVLQVARIGAVYPVEFREPGESGPATARATADRLRAAERRLAPRRLALAKSGADALIAKGLLGASQARLLDGIARHAAAAKADEQKALVAFVALGITTLSDNFDLSSDATAKVWLGGLRRMHRQGKQPRPIPRRR